MMVIIGFSSVGAVLGLCRYFRRFAHGQEGAMLQRRKIKAEQCKTAGSVPAVL
jgi:hypothetical protein